MLPEDVHTNGLSPAERYAQSVVNYSKLDACAEYYSGIHYSRLGNFLISPFKSYGDEWAISIPEDDFPSVGLCDLSSTRDDPLRNTFFSRPEEFLETIQRNCRRPAQPVAQENDDDNVSHRGVDPVPIRRRETQSSSQTQVQNMGASKYAGRMVFLRGFPSAKWLTSLGAALDVDPEFFYRHLVKPNSLMFNTPRLDYSYSTPFPESADLIQLRVCNTGSWDMAGPKPTLAVLRERCELSQRNHLNDFTCLRNFSVSDSIVRNFILHDLYNFSIEQKISIEVIYHRYTWSILVWMDCGRDLSHCKSGPWLPEYSLMKSTRLHPIFQHRPRMALTPVSEMPAPATSTAGNIKNPYPQSIEHVFTKYGRYLRSDIMAQDAFYAMTELFEFSAASVDQLLELFENTVQAVPAVFDAATLSELLILKASLDDYRNYIEDVLETVRARGRPKWPRVTEPKMRERADRAAEQLEGRYRRLLARCNRLSEHSASRISILMTMESHRQAEQGMAQTDRLAKLSVLAYIYIPLSFVTSFFGMNFAELQTGQLGIWAFFVTAVPLLVVSFVAWFVDVRGACAAAWALLRRLLVRLLMTHAA